MGDPAAASSLPLHPGLGHSSGMSQPALWALFSIATWSFYVGMVGWQNMSIWTRRQTAFAVFTALLLLNFLTVDPEFQGWADVYYFCGSRLQYCTCSFRWNARGWAKAYILWSFVLCTATGMQKVLIEVGLNGLLPGEEVVTRESIVSICWRLIPYWLNNWEQQWGAECSSMTFELPHFAVELLVILPCIQILCARLKILAMPLVQVLPIDQEPQQMRWVDAIPADGNAHANGVDHALDGNDHAAEDAGGDAAGEGGADAGRAGGAAAARPPGRRRGAVVRDDFAPNILKGFWERKPEQRRLMPRLRANAQVMMFAALITALAAGNALMVPLLLESTVTRHPMTHTIKIAGQHPDWFTDSSSLNLTALATSNLTSTEVEMLRGRLAAYQQPKPPLRVTTSPLIPTQALPVQLLSAWQLDARTEALRQRLVHHVKLLPLRTAIKERSITGVLYFLSCKDLLDVFSPAWTPAASTSHITSRAYAHQPHKQQQQHATSSSTSSSPASPPGGAAAADPEPEPQQPVEVVAGEMATATEPAGVVPPQEQTQVVTDQGAADTAAAVATDAGAAGNVTAAAAAGVQACQGRMPRFRANLLKHSEEMTKMQASDHQSLIPLVESALAVMRLACEKYFVLLTVLVGHLLFKEDPPRAMQVLIRLNAHLSTTFQKIILYSFPAVCWVYGAGFLFSLFVSAVFWGAPIMATYESVKQATTTVRIKALRMATSAELERMGGHCTICWGDMHVADTASNTPSASGAEHHSHGSKGAATASSTAAAPVPTEPAAPASPAATSSAAGPAAAVGASSSGSAVVPHVRTGGAGGSGVQQPGTPQVAGTDWFAVANERRGHSLDIPVRPAGRQAAAGPGTVQAAGGTGGAASSDAFGDAISLAASSEDVDDVSSSHGGSHSSIDKSEENRAWSLPCGHAYHYACLSQWLTQCYSNGVNPTCPMCQARIQLEVRWRFPVPWNKPAGQQLLGPGVLRGAAGVPGQGAAAAQAPVQEEAEAVEGDDELGMVFMPMVNPGAGLGRQRPAGRVRAGAAMRANENLLLPPPMAALGNMHMLRLLPYQRELQELLQDMPQIPPPEDVAMLQLLADREHQQDQRVGGAGAADAAVPRGPALDNHELHRERQVGRADGAAGAVEPGMPPPPPPRPAPPRPAPTALPTLPRTSHDAGSSAGAGSSNALNAGAAAGSSGTEPSRVLNARSAAAAAAVHRQANAGAEPTSHAAAAAAEAIRWQAVAAADMRATAHRLHREQAAAASSSSSSQVAAAAEKAASSLDMPSLSRNSQQQQQPVLPPASSSLQERISNGSNSSSYALGSGASQGPPLPTCSDLMSLIVESSSTQWVEMRERIHRLAAEQQAEDAALLAGVQAKVEALEASQGLRCLQAQQEIEAVMKEMSVIDPVTLLLMKVKYTRKPAAPIKVEPDIAEQNLRWLMQRVLQRHQASRAAGTEQTAHGMVASSSSAGGSSSSAVSQQSGVRVGSSSALVQQQGQQQQEASKASSSSRVNGSGSGMNGHVHGGVVVQPATGNGVPAALPAALPSSSSAHTQVPVAVHGHMNGISTAAAFGSPVSTGPGAGSAAGGSSGSTGTLDVVLPGEAGEPAAAAAARPARPRRRFLFFQRGRGV